jgi:hypothetical protein
LSNFSNNFDIKTKVKFENVALVKWAWGQFARTALASDLPAGKRIIHRCSGSRFDMASGWNNAFEFALKNKWILNK